MPEDYDPRRRYDVLAPDGEKLGELVKGGGIRGAARLSSGSGAD